ncbi:hypothetical protein OF83DRAFT_1025048, partial [Amylostereum chailletii]
VIVERNSIHKVGIQFCHCPGALSHDLQLLDLHLFPATQNIPSTAFMFNLMEDAILENLECK